MAKKEFKVFCKKYWGVFVGLILIVVVPITVLCLCFLKEDSLFDFNAWATIVSGCLAFIGSSLISILLFYNTWVNQYRKERLDYSIDLRNIVDNKIKNFYDYEEIPKNEKQFKFEFFRDEYDEKREYKFIRFVVNNRNRQNSIKVAFEYAEYSIDDEEMKEFSNNMCVVSNFNIFENIEGGKKVFYLGINEEKIKQILSVEKFCEININLYLKVFNDIGYEEYLKLYLSDYNHSYLSKTISAKEISEKKKTQMCVYSNTFID